MSFIQWRRRPVYRTQVCTVEIAQEVGMPLQLLRLVPAYRSPESLQWRAKVAAEVRVYRKRWPLHMRRMFHEERLRHPKPGIALRNVPILPVQRPQFL